MANFMDKLRTLKAEHPPRVLIYGPPGMGKTSLAAEFPAPVFLQVEDGTPAGLELTGMRPESFDDVIGAIQGLYEGDHDFKSLVIDSLDKLEPLVWDAVCAQNNWASIEAPGYGKGYVATAYLWRQLLDGLNALRVERGMNIVLISHSEVERFDDPTSASYSQYQVRLHKSARKLVEDEMDAILLIKQEPAIKSEDQGFNKKRAVAEGGATRWIYCEGRPAFTAKNRFGMPPKLQYAKGKGYEALAPFFPATAA
jgi:Cdc6-like AAA superfamily ATPase